MSLLLNVPGSLFWPTALLMVAVVGWAVITASWKKLFAVGVRQHLWYGGIVLLSVAWAYLNIAVHDVLRLHPMLITSIVLIFGFRLGVLQATAILVATTVIKQYSWQALPFAWCCSVLAPALLTELLLKAVTFIRIQNLFLYTLGIGFLGGMLTSVVIGVFALGGLWLAGAEYFDVVWESGYLFFMLLFPEGFSNGYIVSSLAVMAPHLVKTYDDDFYLHR